MSPDADPADPNGPVDPANPAPAPRATPEEVQAAALTALTLTYSAPMPGCGSRYADRGVAHESRMLSVAPLAGSLGQAGARAVGETILAAVSTARRLTGGADLWSAALLAPLARHALSGLRLELTLARLTHPDARNFARALEVAQNGGRPLGQPVGQSAGVSAGALAGALEISLSAGREATLRDAMRFAAARDALAREYARNYEVTRELAYPALMSALLRAETARGALAQAYLEVLSEVPDLDIAARAGQKEAEEVSRMANGVVKVGGAHDRRGLQQLSNLDGLLRSDSRLHPSATELPVLAAAFLIVLDHGPEFLSYRLRPAGG